MLKEEEKSAIKLNMTQVQRHRAQCYTLTSGRGARFVHYWGGDLALLPKSSILSHQVAVFEGMKGRHLISTKLLANVVLHVWSTSAWTGEAYSRTYSRIRIIIVESRLGVFRYHLVDKWLHCFALTTLPIDNHRYQCLSLRRSMIMSVFTHVCIHLSVISRRCYVNRRLPPWLPELQRRRRSMP